MSNVIAIDGPAASGKSSAARLLAEAIPGSVYVNTGSMYRAVAWKARKCGLDPLHPDPEKLAHGGTQNDPSGNRDGCSGNPGIVCGGERTGSGTAVYSENL